jgi:hypothetical protein
VDTLLAQLDAKPATAKICLSKRERELTANRFPGPQLFRRRGKPAPGKHLCELVERKFARFRAGSRFVLADVEYDIFPVKTDGAPQLSCHPTLPLFSRASHRASNAGDMVSENGGHDQRIGSRSAL